MKRKIVLRSFLFVVCLVATVILGSKNPVYAAEYEYGGDIYTYEILSNGTVRITDFSNEGDLNIPIEIPAQIEGRDVTIIGDRAFCNVSGNLGTIVIPSTVTTIESWAFHNIMIKKYYNSK